MVDYDFPAPEVALFGDPDSASLADAEVDRFDPGLALDGFGGVFGEELAELPLAAAPRPVAAESVGVGGLVADLQVAAGAAPAPDGRSDAVILGPGGPTGAFEGADAEGLGGPPVAYRAGRSRERAPGGSVCRGSTRNARAVACIDVGGRSGT